MSTHHPQHRRKDSMCMWGGEGWWYWEDFIDIFGKEHLRITREVTQVTKYVGIYSGLKLIEKKTKKLIDMETRD